METQLTKKQKVDNDFGHIGELNLLDICHWENPDNIAIEYYDVQPNITTIKYLEVYSAINEVQKFMINVQPGEFIGISYEIPIFCVPTLMLGITSAHHAFVCLPSVHDESEALIQFLDIQYIFYKHSCNREDSAHVFSIHNEPLIFAKLQKSVKKIEPKQKREVFAYAVTTSGSTGNPVVVRVKNSSILPNILDIRKIFDITSKDKVAQLTPLTFDPSIIEIFLALSTGAALFTASKNLKDDPEKLLFAIQKYEVTILQNTPSLLMHRWSLQDLKLSIFGENSKLRILFLGGEPFPDPKILFGIKHVKNSTRIYNIYGITEVSCWASIIEVFPDSNPKNLGRTLSETIFQVKNKDDEIVHEGTGALFIGSNSRICLIGNEDHIQLKFPIFRETGDLVSIDKSGNITYNGRIGRRVKRFGQRVNLNALDEYTCQLDFINNCCSIFSEKKHSLHLFFTTREKNLTINQKDDIVAKVLNHIKKMASIYHPDKIHLVNEFQLNINGKICLRSLEKIILSSENEPNNYNADEFESTWNNYLGDRALTSKFLDVGGTSVIALQIANELSYKTGNEYPELIGKMLNNKTLEECKNYIHQQNTKIKVNVIDGITSVTQKASSGSREIPSKKILYFSHQENICILQKCRGKIIPRIEFEEDNHESSGKLKKIKFEKFYDLLKCVDASPTIFTYPNGKTFATVGSHSGTVITVNLQTYDNWKIKLPDRIEASVLVQDNFKGILGCYDGFIYCFHLKSGEIYWKFMTGDSVKSTAVFCSSKENIFFGSYDHYVYCISLKNGKEVWKTKPGNGSISATPSIHVKTNSVLFGILDGSCVSLNQRTGETIWKYKFKYPIFSAPVVIYQNFIIFCDVTGTFGCFDIHTGAKIWCTEIPGNVFSHLVAKFDLSTNIQSLIISSKNKHTYRFIIELKEIPKAPTLKYRVDCGSPIIATPWVDDNFIVIMTTSGELKILDYENGDILLQHSLKADVYSSPVYHENTIVVGCRDNNLWIFSTIQ